MRKVIIALLFLALFGCEVPKKSAKVEVVGEEVVQVEYTVELNAVVEAEKAMTHEDRMSLYKQQIGLSEYIKNSSVNKKNKVDAALAAVQGDYYWNREKYSGVTDAIEKYLKAEGYGENGNDLDKVSAAKLFRNLAEAVKKADK